MSDAQAASLGMLTPAAGVAAMQGVLLDLAAARSPRAAGVRQLDVNLRCASSFPADENSHASTAPAEHPGRGRMCRPHWHRSVCMVHVLANQASGDSHWHCANAL